MGLASWKTMNDQLINKNRRSIHSIRVDYPKLFVIDDAWLRFKDQYSDVYVVKINLSLSPSICKRTDTKTFERRRLANCFKRVQRGNDDTMVSNTAKDAGTSMLRFCVFRTIKEPNEPRCESMALTSELQICLGIELSRSL